MTNIVSVTPGTITPGAGSVTFNFAVNAPDNSEQIVVALSKTDFSSSVFSQNFSLNGTAPNLTATGIATNIPPGNYYITGASTDYAVNAGYTLVSVTAGANPPTLKYGVGTANAWQPGNFQALLNSMTGGQQQSSGSLRYGTVAFTYSSPSTQYGWVALAENPASPQANANFSYTVIHPTLGAQIYSTLWNGAGASGAVSTTTQPSTSSVVVTDSSGVTWRLFRSNGLADIQTTDFAYLFEAATLTTAPTNVAINVLTETSFQGTWGDASGNETGFKVQYRSRVNGAAALGTYANASGSPVAPNAVALTIVDAATQGQLVQIRVASSNSAGDSIWLESVETWMPNTGVGGGPVPESPPPASTVTSVTISPTTASLAPGATQQFAATVQGANSPSQAVTWSAPAGGTANSSGVYTAPGTPGNAYKMRATSVQDSNVFAEANITVNAVITPTLTISGLTTGTAGSVSTVIVRDEANALVIGATLAWNGSPTGSAGGTTNGSGQASVTLPTSAGGYTLTATKNAVVGNQSVIVPTGSSGVGSLLGSFSIDRQFGGFVGSNEIVVATLKDVNGQPASGVAVGATSTKTAIATVVGGVTDSNGRVSIGANYVSVGLASVSLNASRSGSTITSQPYACFVQPVLTISDIATIEASKTNPKFSDELYPYVFDFSEFLGSGESIVEIINTTSQSLPLSKDAQSNNMLIGDPVIFGQKVVCFVTGGLRGVPYILRCSARTSLGSIATAESKLKIFSQEGQRARII